MVELKLYRSWMNLALDSPHGSSSYVSNPISNGLRVWHLWVEIYSVQLYLGRMGSHELE